MQDTNTPLVTAIFLSFNHEKYLKESLDSLLKQDYPNLEVIISDDNSSDNSYEMLKALVGDQDSRITVRQNEENLGIAEHINTLMALANGELCVAFAADDNSVPQRISVLVDFWLKNNKPASVFSSVWKIDEDSTVIGQMHGKASDFDLPRAELIKNLIYRRAGIFGCAHAWTPELFKQFGNINQNVINEDRVIPLRAALTSSIKHCPEFLVYYRVTSGISAINRETKKEKLFEFNRISSMRELNDLKQNQADCGLISEEYSSLIAGRVAEVELLLKFSQKQYQFKAIIAALRGGARFFKVTDICINYCCYGLKSRFVR